jgi:hypothetical protein
MVNNRPGAAMQYSEWLPNLTLPNDRYCTECRFAVSRTDYFWQLEDVPLPRELPDTNKMFLAWLRYKLQIVWGRSKRGEDPKVAAERLRLETRELQHERKHTSSGIEPPPAGSIWCRRVIHALKWLEGNSDKLMKCSLRECKQFPYFIRDKPHQKYCSGICSAEAEHGRVSNRPPKTKNTKRLSEKGRAKIVDAQKKRWAEFRKQKAQVRGVKGGQRS